MIVDTHIHLYSEEFNDTIHEIIENINNDHIVKLLMPNIDVSSIEPMMRLHNSYPELLLPMMGLHPCYVKDDWEEQLSIVESTLKGGLKKSFVAIGEIGIDLYWDKSTLPVQIQAFEKQIQWALELELPVVIHARDSIDEIIAVLKKYYPAKVTGVMHCYTGNDQQATILAALGFYFGIGGVITYKKNDELRSVISKLPIERLLLETDGPYLPPHPHRGKINIPNYITYTASMLAQTIGVDYSTLCELTTKNATTLFRF